MVKNKVVLKVNLIFELSAKKDKQDFLEKIKHFKSKNLKGAEVYYGYPTN